jgi:antitoxin component YwqK of YwqJK toxin-antitoxin module
MPNYSITTLYQNNRAKATALVKSSYSFRDLLGDNSYSPVFKDCIHHGLFMNFYDNGIMKDSGYYKNGLREGVWIEGQNNKESYWTGSFTNGIKTGTWKHFNQQKKMVELIVYKNGKTNWRKKY